jgi:hypothetical protein
VKLHLYFWLQNQIASQQAIYVKQQQQQQQHHMTPQGPQPDFFKPNVHDPLTQIQANFGELNIKEPPVLLITSLHGQGEVREITHVFLAVVCHCFVTLYHI